MVKNVYFILATNLKKSKLLNDFESIKENRGFENYIYDQEYFGIFNINGQIFIAMYLSNFTKLYKINESGQVF